MGNIIVGVPYAVEQNEPSKPILLERTDDEYLTRVFFNAVLNADDDIALTIDRTPSQYGDIKVAYNDEVFLYVTILP